MAEHHKIEYCKNVPLNDIIEFVRNLFGSLGATATNADVIANDIAKADYMGLHTEGISRLETYIQEIEDGVIDVKAEPKIESEFGCVAIVNGNNAPGSSVGNFCYNLALKKLQNNGISSSHFGVGVRYTLQALQSGLIGISFTNTEPCMPPPGAIDVVLGPNPLSVGIPAYCDGVLIDMATSAVTWAKIEQYKENKAKLPRGWAFNEMTLDEQEPEKALKARKLVPLGGRNQTYKGFGFAMFVEIVTGILAGANYGYKIPQADKKQPLNLALSFMLIDPQYFHADFKNRVSKLLNHLRSMEPLDPKKPVMIPGDKIKSHMRMAEAQGGIRYLKSQLEILDRLAKKYNIKPIPRIEEPLAEKEKANELGEKPKVSQLVTPVEEARRFIIDCFVALGVDREKAEIMAENLVRADLRGHYSHGINRLGRYLDDVEKGICNPNAPFTVEKETASSAVVNGNNGFGSVVGTLAMNLAIKKAKEVGVAMVVAYGSNHFGVTQIYSLQASDQGLIGFSCTGTSPIVVPTRAKTGALGTNPIAVTAPGLNGDSFIMDVCTSATAFGKIEIYKKKGQKIPYGWAINDEGKVETDAEIAFKTSKLLPLGGTELTGGYKGYALSLFVDILSGVLSGGNFGPFIRRWGASTDPANIGHAFFAIDPKRFSGGFEDRLSDLMNHIRNLKPFDPTKPVMVHGDSERNNMEKVKKDGGFIYIQGIHDLTANLAEKLKVKPMVSIMKEI